MEKIKVFRFWDVDDHYDFRTQDAREKKMIEIAESRSEGEGYDGFERVYDDFELDEFHVYDSPFMVFNRWVFEEDKTWEQNE